MNRGHTYPGRGASGISSSGPENYNTFIAKPDIGGRDGGVFIPKNNGIKIKSRSARKKSRINNPRI